MKKRKFRIEKVVKEARRENSILYGKVPTKTYGYCIYFYDNPLLRIFRYRHYLEIQPCGASGFRYDIWNNSSFGTKFDTVDEAKEMIKLINEHPESFRHSPTNKDY